MLFSSISYAFLLASLLNIAQILAIVKKNETNASVSSGAIMDSTVEGNKTGEPLDRSLMSGRDNATFYYDPDSFLIQSNISVKTSPPGDTRSELKGIAKISHPTRDIKGRNGRMLDLDELVGDFAQARLNKQNRVSGSRQSRILNDSPMDIGHGKKLAIQGFIPIVSIKDINSDEKFDDSASESISKKSTVGLSNQEENSLNGAQINQYLSSLPHAQSSPGHASVGIRPPYPDGYNDMSDNFNYASSQQQPGVDAKYLTGPGSLSSNPFKKAQNKKLGPSGGLSMLNSLISGVSSTGSESNQIQENMETSDCICVPFYMCRSGYLSESSLTKDQIQQLIQSQQQQTPNLQNSLLGKQNTDDFLSTIANSNQIPSIGQSVTLQQQQQQQQQLSLQQQESYVPVDERSMDKISSEDSHRSNNLNETMGSQGGKLMSRGESSPIDQSSDNNTQGTLTQYSQDILGRMLGIKNDANSCGVLRTCCRVVMNSSPSIDKNYASTQMEKQQQMMQSISQQSTLLQSPVTLNKPIPQYQQVPPSLFSMQLQQQQEQNALKNRPTVNQAGTAFNPMYPDALSHTQQLQTKQQNFNSLTNNAQQISPIQSNLNQKASQALIQVPLNHLLATRHGQSPSMQTNTQLQPYQSTRSYGAPPLAANSNIIPQYLRPPSVLGHQQVQAQVQSQSNLVDYSRSGLQHNYHPASALRHQTIEINQLGQPSQHQALQSAIRSSQPLQSSAPLPSSSSLSSVVSQHRQSAQPVNQKRMLEGRCGIRNAVGITGRVQNLQYEVNSADFGEYPSQVAILKRLAGSDSLYVCAGTLISQQWIATAAHCIKKYTNMDLKVRLGEWDVHRDDEFYPFVEKNIRDIVIHTDFVAGNLVNDIALLRMDSPVDPSLPHISPACLPNSDETFTGLRCWVTGWGKDTFGQKGSFQSVLKEVDLPVVGQRECEQALRQTRLGQYYRLHSGFICAGGEGGKDACEGDGGSGLYCVQDGLIKAIGLVSWGIGCGQAGVPGVYVNLAHYRVWIENIISVDEDLYGPYPNLVGSNSLISERSHGANVTGSDFNSSQALPYLSRSTPETTVTPEPMPLISTTSNPIRSDAANEISNEADL